MVTTSNVQKSILIMYILGSIMLMQWYRECRATISKVVGQFLKIIGYVNSLSIMIVFIRNECKKDYICLSTIVIISYTNKVHKKCFLWLYRNWEKGNYLAHKYSLRLWNATIFFYIRHITHLQRPVLFRTSYASNLEGILWEVWIVAIFISMLQFFMCISWEKLQYTSSHLEPLLLWLKICKMFNL